MLGQGVALSIAEGIREKRVSPFGQIQGYLLAFGLLALAPVVLYLYLTYPDWCRMYLWAPDRRPGRASCWGLAVAPPALLLWGYSLTRRWITLGKERPARQLMLFLSGLTAVVVLLGWNRISHVGTATEFRLLTAPSLARHPVLLLLIGLGSMLVASYGVLLRLARRAAAGRLGWEPIPPGEILYPRVPDPRRPPGQGPTA